MHTKDKVPICDECYRKERTIRRRAEVIADLPTVSMTYLREVMPEVPECIDTLTFQYPYEGDIPMLTEAPLPVMYKTAKYIEDVDGRCSKCKARLYVEPPVTITKDGKRTVRLYVRCPVCKGIVDNRPEEEIKESENCKELALSTPGTGI
jgi:hypothetical protein